MVGGIILFLIGGFLLPFTAYGNDELLELQSNDSQWVLQRKNYSATGFSGLTQITPENIKRLKVAWSFSTGTNKGHEGGPLVVGTTMFVHSSFPTHVYALDLTREGAPMKWKYTPRQNEQALAVTCCDPIHRGLNYAAGKILMVTLDGQVIALDATTGKELWKVQNADITKGETMTGSGLVIKDKFIVGIAGGEFGVRTHLTAYNIHTGERVWRAYTAGPDEDLLLARDFNVANPHYGRFGTGSESWPNTTWQQSGGGIWGWTAWDPELDLFYYTTGNPGPWNPTQRQGDNKWTTSILARDPDTGEAKWAYQFTPWDAWDYDSTNNPILTEQRIDGKDHKVLTHFDKNGFVYTLDRANGTLLEAQAYVFVNWAQGIDKKTGRPIEVPEKRTHEGESTDYICPSYEGGNSPAAPPAYSPKTRLFYAATMNLCMDFKPYQVKYIAGVPYIGFEGLIHPGSGGYLGEFIAWDPATGKKVWGIKEPLPVWSGALVTASDVVFYGTLDGWVKAAHARSGELLWKHKVGSGIVSLPISYLGPDGRQYVALYSGIGGDPGLPLEAARDDPYAAYGWTGLAVKSGLYDIPRGGMLHVFTLD